MTRRRKTIQVKLDEPLRPLQVGGEYTSARLVVTSPSGVVGELTVPADPALSARDVGAAISERLGERVWADWAASALLSSGVSGAGTREDKVSPDVSVVVRTRGVRELLDRCLEALSRLRTAPSEIVIASSSRRAVELNMLRTSGSILAMIDERCVVDEGWLDGIAEAFDADRLLMAVAAWVGPGSDRRRVRPIEPIVVTGPWRTRVPFPVHGALFRREVLPGIAGLPEPSRPRRILPWGDREIFSRVLAASYRVAFDPARIVWREAGPRPLGRRSRSRREIVTPGPRPFATSSSASQPNVEVRAEPPMISVAIASHNRRQMLREVLDGFATQTYPPQRYEVVVVLDGSSDGSAKMIEAFQSPCRLRLAEQDHGGLASARNRGLAEAEHPIVLFFDDDIIPARDLVAVHALAHARATGKHVALGYSPPVVDGSLMSLSLREWWEDHFRTKAERGHCWSFLDFTDANASLSASLLRDAGAYDEAFRSRRQDWDLGERLLQANGRFAFHRAARGTHQLDTSLHTAIRGQRAEGRADVMLASKHPHLSLRLPWAAFARAVIERRRGLNAIAFRHPRRVELALQRGAELAALLERRSIRAAWRTFVPRLLHAAYLLGVNDAVASLVGFRALAEPVLRREHVQTVRIDVNQLAGIQLPSAPATEIVLTSAGKDLVAVPAALPGQQCNWRHLSDRFGAAAGPPLAKLARSSPQLVAGTGPRALTGLKRHPPAGSVE